MSRKPLQESGWSIPAGVALATFALASFVTTEARSQTPNDALQRRVEEVLTRREAQIVEVRRDIHRNPEVSGAEERTAGIVAARLKELGLEVRTRIGGHGVVGLLKGGRPGPLVAFRADMDAVPSNDPDPVEFRSIKPGVRHICGHDIHTAVGLALAEGLAAVRSELAGTVMFVFQPAEERATGAKAMLADGLFTTPKPVAIFAVHTAPFPVGVLGTTPGVMMAGRDFIKVTVSGSGNLQSAADSARKIIQGVGTITGAQAIAPGPENFVFAQVGPARQSGSSWTVEGSLTMASPTVRASTRDQVLRALTKLSSGGLTVSPTYEVKAIAGVTNDSGLVEQANAAIRSTLGNASVVPVNGIYPAFSEDFGSFQEQVPGVFYFLGVANQTKGLTGMPHSPDYVPDEGSILVAAKAMTAAILDRLAGVRRPAS